MNTAQAEAPARNSGAETPRSPAPLAVRSIPTFGETPALNRVAFEPTDFESAAKLAQWVAESGLAPSGIDTWQKAFIVLQTGREFGFTAMQSFRFLYVVNGRVAMWTAAKVALVVQSPLCEKFEIVESSREKAVVKVKRKGRPERIFTWDIEKARLAGLWGDPKRQPWVKFPHKMLLNRTENDACEEEFPEITSGIVSVEVAQDMIDMGNAQRVDPPAVEPTPEPAAVRLPGQSKRRAATENVVPIAQPVVPSSDASTPAVAAPTNEQAPPAAEESKAATTKALPLAEKLMLQAMQAVGVTQLGAAREAALTAVMNDDIPIKELRGIYRALLKQCATAQECGVVASIFSEIKDQGIPGVEKVDLEKQIEEMQTEFRDRRNEIVRGGAR